MRIPRTKPHSVADLMPADYAHGPHLVGLAELCLELDPSRRPSAAMALQHPFFGGFSDDPAPGSGQPADGPAGGNTPGSGHSGGGSGSGSGGRPAAPPAVDTNLPRLGGRGGGGGGGFSLGGGGAPILGSAGNLGRSMDEEDIDTLLGGLGFADSPQHKAGHRARPVGAALEQSTPGPSPHGAGNGGNSGNGGGGSGDGSSSSRPGSGGGGGGLLPRPGALKTAKSSLDDLLDDLDAEMRSPLHTAAMRGATPGVRPHPSSASSSGVRFGSTSSPFEGETPDDAATPRLPGSGLRGSGGSGGGNGVGNSGGGSGGKGAATPPVSAFFSSINGAAPRSDPVGDMFGSFSDSDDDDHHTADGKSNGKAEPIGQARRDCSHPGSNAALSSSSSSSSSSSFSSSSSSSASSSSASSSLLPSFAPFSDGELAALVAAVELYPVAAGLDRNVRWRKIAAQVGGGRNKKECFDVFKAYCASLKARKQAHREKHSEKHGEKHGDAQLAGQSPLPPHAPAAAFSAGAAAPSLLTSPPPLRRGGVDDDDLGAGSSAGGGRSARRQRGGVQKSQQFGPPAGLGEAAPWASTLGASTEATQEAVEEF